MLQQLLRRLSGTNRKARPGLPKKRPTRLGVEQLERRDVPAVGLTEFPIPVGPVIGRSTQDIIADNSGNIWLGEYGFGFARLDRVTPDGQWSQFALPGQGTRPDGLTDSPHISDLIVGPDGNIWFTQVSRNLIGRFALATQDFTYFDAGSLDDNTQLLSGPDGNIWFLDATTNTIGRMTPTGAVTRFAGATNVAPDNLGRAQELLSGPDGNVWFTESSVSKVGKITPTGTISELTMPHVQKSVVYLVAGPDGNLWGSTYDGGNVRITPSGDVTFYGGLRFSPNGDVADYDYDSEPGRGAPFVAPDGTMWIRTLYSRILSEPVYRPDGRLLTPAQRTSDSTGYARLNYDGSVTPLYEGMHHANFAPMGSVVGAGQTLWGKVGGYVGNTEVRLVRYDLNLAQPYPVTISPVAPIHATPGQFAYDTPLLATIVDRNLYPAGQAPEAFVDYGDGTVQTYVGNDVYPPVYALGIVEVYLRHDYAQEGNYTITVGTGVNLPQLPAPQPSSNNPPFNYQVAVLAPVTIAEPPEERFVRQVYRDVLYREGEVAGVAYWADRLKRGVSRESVARDIQSSDESQQKIIEGLYESLLNRGSDPAGLRAWMDYLDQGASLEQLKAGFFGSEEYWLLRGHGTDAGFLTALYQDALNRAADEIALTAWAPGLTGGRSARETALLVLGSTEAANKAVSDAYQNLLRRAPDDSGRQAWSQFLLHNRGVADLVTGLLASEEYNTHRYPVVLPNPEPALGAPGIILGKD